MPTARDTKASQRRAPATNTRQSATTATSNGRTPAPRASTSLAAELGRTSVSPAAQRFVASLTATAADPRISGPLPSTTTIQEQPPPNDGPVSYNTGGQDADAAPPVSVPSSHDSDRSSLSDDPSEVGATHDGEQELDYLATPRVMATIVERARALIQADKFLNDFGEISDRERQIATAAVRAMARAYRTVLEEEGRDFVHVSHLVRAMAMTQGGGEPPGAEASATTAAARTPVGTKRARFQDDEPAPDADDDDPARSPVAAKRPRVDPTTADEAAAMADAEMDDDIWMKEDTWFKVGPWTRPFVKALMDGTKRVVDTEPGASGHNLRAMMTVMHGHFKSLIGRRPNASDQRVWSPAVDRCMIIYKKNADVKRGIPYAASATSLAAGQNHLAIGSASGMAQRHRDAFSEMDKAVALHVGGPSRAYAAQLAALAGGRGVHTTYGGGSDKPGNRRGSRAGRGGRPGGPPSFVPHDKRKCFRCGKVGHIGADCKADKPKDKE
jgi:Zinc knuckle